MAKSVVTVEEVELLDGTLLEVRPVSIKRQRQSLKTLAEELEESSDTTPDPLTKRLLEVFSVIYDENPNVAHLVGEENYEALEDAVDIETLKYILKVAIKFDLDAMLKVMEKSMVEQAGTTST